MNLKFKKYTQSNILYYLNNNLKRNRQKSIKTKTLQSYLYKLEKELKVTINYYKHLGKNYGTEIYYKLRYPKERCYHNINSYFKKKREKKFNERLYKYLCSKQNINEQKWECINNINNTNIKNTNSNLSHKDKKIKTNKENKANLKIKQGKLREILNCKEKELLKANYDKNLLKKELNKIYEKYAYKPHFIIENHKYKDLDTLLDRIKETIPKEKIDTEENIRNNIFSILLEQLREKTDIKVLIPILKKYLSNIKTPDYSKIVNNCYFYELLEIIGKV